MNIPKIHKVTILLLTLIVAHVLGTTASAFHSPRKLAGQKSTNQSIEISPAPGPAWNDEERCWISSKRSCHDQLSNVSVCVLYAHKAHKDSVVLVQNEGEGLLEINVTILNTKITFPEIKLAKNQTKKINIPANNESGSSSIMLKTGHVNCTIPLGQKEQSKLYRQFYAYATQLTPIHGAYFLFLGSLIVGGVCAWCKLGRNEGQQQNGGVAYQELQMAEPEIHPTNNVETAAEGWDQDWDDDWGEEIKEEKSPNGHIWDD
ncbi:hypothetical protein Tsubulata_020594 [Turnera subulata]|uniref:DUF7356 domain-containing protein n=1 Tax=Turnera subulata TaxID=218843 RepID=A0A9Q0G5V3_9ROSI|nr:hypothetical protein Tsubulata_020594 [Turnera subulata]